MIHFTCLILMSRNRYRITGTNMEALPTVCVLCVGILLCIHISTPCVCLEPAAIRGEHWIPWNWTYSWFPVTMWVVGRGPESSARAGVL